MRKKLPWLGTSISAVIAFIWAALELFGPKEWSLVWLGVSFVVAAGASILFFARENHELQRQLDDRALRHGKAKALGPYLSEGEAFRSMTKCPDMQARQRWEARTEAFLRDELGPDYIDRFGSGAAIQITVPQGLEKDVKDNWCHMHTRCARLNEFIAELRR